MKDPITQLAGYLAKTNSAITKKRKQIKDGTLHSSGPKGKKGRKSKIGKRPDLSGLFVRSGWEANCLRLFNYFKDNQYPIFFEDKVISAIEYEPAIFSFAQFGILKGTVSYCPDIKLIFKDGTYIWIEIKGYLKPQDKTKIRRFKKFFPAEYEKLYAITGSIKTKASEFFVEQKIPFLCFYNDLNKEYRKEIPHWE